MSIFSDLKKTLSETMEVSGYNILAVGAVGVIGHPVYWLWWTYIDPQPYESAWMRGIGFLSCLLLLVNQYWPKSVKKFLPIYWFWTVLYTLPFFFTYYLIASNYSKLWSTAWFTMIFCTITVLPKYSVIFLNTVLGIGLAALYAHFTVPEYLYFDQQLFVFTYFPVLVFAIFVGTVFSYSNLKGILAQEKNGVMRILAGSIAHEMRNPLAQIKYSLDSAENRLPRPSANMREHALPNLTLDQLYADLAHGQLAIRRGSQIIDMTLDEVRGKNLDPARFAYLSAREIAHKAIAEYGYETEGERNKVSLNTLQDFTFKGDETVMLFILFNLIKNALYYFKTKPEATLFITVDQHAITVKDTGPGIPKEFLIKLFESFQTEGKQGGTGLGLSYCKRSMQAFGGDITCDSALGEYTEFTLSFPAVPQTEIDVYQQGILEQARVVLHDKRILIVDDDLTFRLSTPVLLKDLGAEIEVAENGQVALDLLARKQYDLLLLDLNMPVLDGYATAEKIRAGAVPGHRHVPIIAYTTESAYMTQVKTQKVGINGFVSKPCSQIQLIQTVLQTLEQCAEQTTHLAVEEAKDIWSGKTVLIADDSEGIRLNIRSMLMGKNVQIAEASHGKAVLDYLQSGQQCDLILMDRRMPGMSGTEASQAIRSQKSLYQHVPIVMVTGDSDENAIQEAQATGVNYFITKPIRTQKLYEILHLVFTQTKNVSDHSISFQVIETTQSDTIPSARKILLDGGMLAHVQDSVTRNNLVSAFCKEIPELLEALAESIQNNDKHYAQVSLHKLKGSSSNIGAELLYSMANAFHNNIKQGYWPQDDNWLQYLEDTYTRTQAALQSTG